MTRQDKLDAIKNQNIQVNDRAVLMNGWKCYVCSVDLSTGTITVRCPANNRKYTVGPSQVVGPGQWK